MSFGGLLFTNLGKNLQAKSMTGSELRFTKIVIGDGELGSGSILDLRNVVHEIKSLEITKLKSTPDGKAILGTKFDNNTILVGFYWREIGVFAMDPDIGEILYCYGNAGTNADYIPASGGAQVIEKVIDLPIIIGNATNVTATIASGVYVLAEDFENEVNSINTEIIALKEQNKNLAANKADLVNGKVPSEQLPSMNYLSPTGEGKDVKVTFTESTSRANIITGEKLSELFGKVKKYFTDLKTVAFTGSYTDLSNKPTSLPANGGTSSACSGNSATATKLQTSRQINGVSFDGSANITIADGTKAPTNHASTGTSYGLGTTANYGHVKIRDNLTAMGYTTGEVLSSYQGKVLDNVKVNKATLIRTLTVNTAVTGNIAQITDNFAPYDTIMFKMRGNVTFNNTSTGRRYDSYGLSNASGGNVSLVLSTTETYAHTSYTINNIDITAARLLYSDNVPSSLGASKLLTKTGLISTSDYVSYTGNSLYLIHTGDSSFTTTGTMYIDIYGIKER